MQQFWQNLSNCSLHTDTFLVSLKFHFFFFRLNNLITFSNCNSARNFSLNSQNIKKNWFEVTVYTEFWQFSWLLILQNSSFILSLFQNWTSHLKPVVRVLVSSHHKTQKKTSQKSKQKFMTVFVVLRTVNKHPPFIWILFHFRRLSLCHHHRHLLRHQHVEKVKMSFLLFAVIGQNLAFFSARDEEW